MLISIRHITRYSYAEPVSYTIQSLRLTPASFTPVSCWMEADTGRPVASVMFTVT